MQYIAVQCSAHWAAVLELVVRTQKKWLFAKLLSLQLSQAGKQLREGVGGGKYLGKKGRKSKILNEMSITVLINDNGLINRFVVFLYKPECLCIVLRIQNLERHQNCKIGSKVTTILTMFFVHD